MVYFDCLLLLLSNLQLRAILRERLLVAIANGQGYGLDAIVTTTTTDTTPLSPLAHNNANTASAAGKTSCYQHGSHATQNMQ
jgi:hypothetical protein